MSILKEECVVCYDRLRNTRLCPCGHELMCESCSAQILGSDGECPLCRIPIFHFDVGDEYGHAALNRPADELDMNVESPLTRAYKFWTVSDLDECERILDGEILSQDSENIDAIALRGSCYSYRWEFKNALLWCSKTLEKEPSSILSLLTKRQVLGSRNRGKRTEEYADVDEEISSQLKLVDWEKINNSFWLTVASICLRIVATRQDDPVPMIKDSIILSSRAILLNPNCLMAYNSRGNAFDRIKNAQCAVQDFNTAIRINSRCMLAYANRGACYMHMDKNKEAIEDLTIAVRMFPENTAPDLWFARGVVHHKMGEIAKAIEDYTRCLEIDDEDYGCFWNRGIGRRALKDHPQAASDFSRAIEIRPGSYTAYWNRGVTYKKMGLFSNAIADYNKALELTDGSESVIIRKARGISLSAQNNHEAALEDLSYVLNVEPHDFQARYHRGKVYFNLQRWDEALHDLAAIPMTTSHFDKAAQLVREVFEKRNSTEHSTDQE